MLKFTKWFLFQCGKGSRFSSTKDDYAGQICDMAGCNCNTVLVKKGETLDLHKARRWFRSPIAEYHK